MEYELTPLQTDKIIAIRDDLKIQAMIFDMDIDWETLTLVEKRKDDTPQWLKNWQAKRLLSDNDPASPEQAWA